MEDSAAIEQHAPMEDSTVIEQDAPMEDSPLLEQVASENSFIDSNGPPPVASSKRLPCSLRNLLWEDSPSIKKQGIENVVNTLRNENLHDIRVLRLKNEGLSPFATEAMMNRVLEALGECTTVQVLYIQNFANGMRDQQLAKLTEVLKKGFIWGLNIGESWNISRGAWERFGDDLKDTHVTHMYASEGTVILSDLKTKMMNNIRENRKKDTRHFDPENSNLINRISNMWFNPRSSTKYQAQFFSGCTRDDPVYDPILFTPGTVCWARIRGTSFWPCVVKSPTSDSPFAARPGQILVFFLNDVCSDDHAFVCGSNIQPWSMRRVSEKSLQRKSRYRHAVQMAVFLIIKNRMRNSRYSKWFQKLADHANEGLSKDCSVVDSLLPGGDKCIRSRHLVWVTHHAKSYPAQVYMPYEIETEVPEDVRSKLGPKKSKSSILVRFFGQGEWQWAKPENICKFGEHCIPARGAACEAAVLDCMDFAEKIVARVTKSETLKSRGILLQLARKNAISNGTIAFDPTNTQVEMVVSSSNAICQRPECDVELNETMEYEGFCSKGCSMLRSKVTKLQAEKLRDLTSLTSFTTCLHYRRLMNGWKEEESPTWLNHEAAFISSPSFSRLVDLCMESKPVFASDVWKTLIFECKGIDAFFFCVKDAPIRAIFSPAPVPLIGCLGSDFGTWNKEMYPGANDTQYGSFLEKVEKTTLVVNDEPVYLLSSLITHLADVPARKGKSLLQGRSENNLKLLLNLHNTCVRLCGPVDSRDSNSTVKLRSLIGFPDRIGEEIPVEISTEVISNQIAAKPAKVVGHANDVIDIPSDYELARQMQLEARPRRATVAKKRCKYSTCQEECMGEYCTDIHKRYDLLEKEATPPISPVVGVLSKKMEKPRINPDANRKQLVAMVTEELSKTRFYALPDEQVEEPVVVAEEVPVNDVVGNRRKRNSIPPKICLNPECTAQVTVFYCSDICKRKTALLFDTVVEEVGPPVKRARMHVSGFESLNENSIKLFLFLSKFKYLSLLAFS